MIDIFYSPYELYPVLGGRAHQGALLKVVGNDGVGYSDLFPWPKFGDLAIEEQLLSIKQGQPTSLAECSLELARRDAILRKQEQIVKTEHIRNHFLVQDLKTLTEEILQQKWFAGFRTIKIKLNGSEQLKLLETLFAQNDFKIRLDLNAQLDFSECKKFFSSFSLELQSKIEFVEDPVPWSFQHWTELAKFVPLALDFELASYLKNPGSGKAPFHFLIFKPARQKLSLIEFLTKELTAAVIVTSSLDHPLGVLHSLRFASTAGYDSGCLTFSYYQPTEFNDKIITQGPFVRQTSDFDDILTGMKWNKLIG